MTYFNVKTFLYAKENGWGRSFSKNILSFSCMRQIYHTFQILQHPWPFLNVSWPFLSFSVLKKVTNGRKCSWNVHANRQKRLGTLEPGRRNAFERIVKTFTLQKPKNNCNKNGLIITVFQAQKYPTGNWGGFSFNLNFKIFE